MLTSIQGTLGILTAPAHANVRITPAFQINAGGTGTGQVLNVSDAVRTIAIDVYRLNGDRTGGHSQPVQPGAGYLLGVTASTIERTTSYCKFTVEDGSRTDIRAAGQVYEPGADPLNDVAAIVAAE
jgi:hypothetical protein